MRKLIYLCLFVMVASGLFAQSKLSHNTRNYLQKSSVTEVISESAQTPQYAVRSVAGREMISAFVHFTDGIDVSLLEAYDAIVESKFSTIVTALIPADQIEALSEEPSIKYIEMGQQVFTKMNVARNYTHVTSVHNGQAPLMQAFTGAGTLVGVIDCGFQYNHANFYDNNGNLRIKRVWNQNGSGTPPDGYAIGNELKTQSDLEYAAYDIRSNSTGGHGAHVLGIAAGADKNNGNDFYGVATEADIALVSFASASVANFSTNVLNGINYLFDYADEVNKPMVINLSLGMHTGPHDGTSSFDIASDELQGPGRIIVGAAGNEGADQLHISKEFNDTDTVLKSFVNFFSTTYRIGNVDIWGSENMKYSVQLVLYERSSKDIKASSLIYPADSTASYTVRLTGASGSIKVSTGINPLNNKPNTYIDYSINSINTGNFIGIIIRSDSGTVHAWADNNYSSLHSQYQVGWTMGNNESSMGEIGGTGNRIITVGSYTTKARTGYGQTLNQISTFSSKGPTADGRIKPDITAPGAVIASSLPNLSVIVNSADIEKTNYVNGTNHYYGYMQGTSMATPHVTGVIALWLQGDPTLTPERIREIMDETSLIDSYTGADIPNNTWGRGKLDAYTGMASVMSTVTKDENPSLPDVVMIYPNPTSGEFNLAFKEADEEVRISVVNLAGQIISSEYLKYVHHSEIRTYDLSNVADGAYIVRVTGKQINQTYRLLINK